ncbi:MAG: hypothetical protein ABI969_12865 [bacterium]
MAREKEEGAISADLSTEVLVGATLSAGVYLDCQPLRFSAEHMDAVVQTGDALWGRRER